MLIPMEKSDTMGFMEWCSFHSFIWFAGWTISDVIHAYHIRINACFYALKHQIYEIYHLKMTQHRRLINGKNMCSHRKRKMKRRDSFAGIVIVCMCNREFFHFRKCHSARHNQFIKIATCDCMPLDNNFISFQITIIGEFRQFQIKTYQK